MLGFRVEFDFFFRVAAQTKTIKPKKKAISTIYSSLKQFHRIAAEIITV